MDNNTYRFKPRASAAQRKSLADFVSRHFCFRYGSEVVPLQRVGAHSAAVFTIDPKEHIAVALVTLFKRKMHSAPVVITRRCICRLQSRKLCGVCALRGRASGARFFPSLSYAEGLAYLKSAAVRLQLECPASWGTHAFRRGWADEALKEGGPAALFYSGGWRGVTAFAYASALARSSVEAAEWAIEFSESSEGSAA